MDVQPTYSIHGRSPQVERDDTSTQDVKYCARTEFDRICQSFAVHRTAIAEENSLHLDMREFNHMVAFNPAKSTITVELGITWREIQQIIDPHNFSVSFMHTYANFTVGRCLFGER